jgi:acyl carrier protein
MTDNIENFLIKLLENQTSKRPILPNHYLKEDLSLDSLDMVEILLEIEEKFQVSIEESEIKTTISVNEFIGIIKQSIQQ